MNKHQILQAIVKKATSNPQWPKQAGGRPYPCAVTSIDTQNGAVSVVKLDDSFFTKNGGNQQVLDQLTAQVLLTREAIEMDGVRVSTFYKAKDGTPRPGFQVTIPGAIEAGEGRAPTKTVQDRLAEAWAQAMGRLSEEQVDELANALDGKPDAFCLAKLERALKATPSEPELIEDGEEIPF